MKQITQERITELFALCTFATDGGEFALTNGQNLYEIEGFDVPSIPHRVFVVKHSRAENPEHFDYTITPSDFPFIAAWEFDNARDATCWYGKLSIEDTYNRMK